MKLYRGDIEHLIVDAITDASDYLHFMQSDDNNAQAWARINEVEIESEDAYNEAIENIKEAFESAAKNLLENRDIDDETQAEVKLRNASDNELRAIA